MQKRTSPGFSLTFFALDIIYLEISTTLGAHLGMGYRPGPLRAKLAGSKGPLRATLVYTKERGGVIAISVRKY